MGRVPWSHTAAEAYDEEAIEDALELREVAHLADRSFPMLSGGERTRAALARVLAQRTQLILLDEPTAALDLHHQELVLQIVRDRVRAGAGSVVVLHDLALAAAYADRVVVLSDGHIVANGAPTDVLTVKLLSAVYQHDIEVIPHPHTGELIILPRR
jgi:iron complex transport system ATP-binding protein